MVIFQRQKDLLQMGKDYGQGHCKLSSNSLATYHSLANELPTGFQPNGPSSPHGKTSTCLELLICELPKRMPSDLIYQNQIYDFSSLNLSPRIHLETRPRSHPSFFLPHPPYLFLRQVLWVLPSTHSSNPTSPLHHPLCHLSSPPLT